MLQTIAIIVVALIAIILILAATKPDTFRVQRAIDIQAPPEKIFPLIDDFHQWGAWSPWEKMDLGMKKTFSGAATGKGSVYEWDGNNKVGAGRMQITESSAPAKIVIKLDFIRPFEGHNITEFTLMSKGGSTEVSWTMTGPAPFISKIMTVFMSMDKMVGKDFEAGLRSMKAAAEK